MEPSYISIFKEGKEYNLRDMLKLTHLHWFYCDKWHALQLHHNNCMIKLQLCLTIYLEELLMPNLLQMLQFTQTVKSYEI